MYFSQITFHPKLVNQSAFPLLVRRERLMFQFLTSSWLYNVYGVVVSARPNPSKPFAISYALNNNNDLTLKRKGKTVLQFILEKYYPILFFRFLRLPPSENSTCIKKKFAFIPCGNIKIYVRLIRDDTRGYRKISFPPKMRFAC